jgi:hypothetical protein
MKNLNTKFPAIKHSRIHKGLHSRLITTFLNFITRTALPNLPEPPNLLTGFKIILTIRYFETTGLVKLQMTFNNTCFAFIILWPPNLAATEKTKTESRNRRFHR